MKHVRKKYKINSLINEIIKKSPRFLKKCIRGSGVKLTQILYLFSVDNKKADFD